MHNCSIPLQAGHSSKSSTSSVVDQTAIIPKATEMDEVLVLMVPFPAQGHLNQLLHLSHVIISYGLPVHYAGSSYHNHQAKLRLCGWDPHSMSKIHFHDLQLPSYSSPPPTPDNSFRFPTHLQPLFDASVHLRQPVFQLMQQLSTKFRRVVVIHDSLMTSVVQDIKMVPNAENYAFEPTSAFTFLFNSWENAHQEPPFLLDCSDVQKSIPSNDGCFTPEVIRLAKYQRGLMGFESGRLYNTSRVIEGYYIELLEKLLANDKIKHFTVGPLNTVGIKQSNDEHKRHECLQWLDKQETGSVIYVSFGSTVSMIDEQIKELALGLERSMQNFVWVLIEADTGDIITGGADIRKPELPEGYEERVKNRGMVVKEWVPQLEILGHSSVGGFLSHCGWNSCMESISMGVPIMAWPMHSDQPRNAFLVTDVLRTGTLVRDWRHRDELVSSASVDNAVRRLMLSEEGKKMQKRAAKVGDAVRASVAKDGASRLDMDSFISHITR